MEVSSSSQRDAYMRETDGSVVQIPTRLRVNALFMPLSIDDPIPRFSWSLSHPNRGEFQSAYHLVLSEVVTQRTVWDSGIVNSSLHVNTLYLGPNLTSNTDYNWTVLFYDSVGVASLPASSSFSTALFSSDDWRGSVWLAGNGNAFRATFNVSAPVSRARLFLSGLGTAKAWVNGNATDDHQLGQYANVVSMVTRFLYDVIDVTSLVSQGCNTLGVQLFGGWWAQKPFPWGGSGGPQFRVLLSVTTSAGVTTYYASSPSHNSTPGGEAEGLPFISAGGPITGAGIYSGETYDARVAQALKGWDSSCDFIPDTQRTWSPAEQASDWGAVMSAHHVWVRTDEEFTGVVTNPMPGTWVFDFGVSFFFFFRTELPWLVVRVFSWSLAPLFLSPRLPCIVFSPLPPSPPLFPPKHTRACLLACSKITHPKTHFTLHQAAPREP